MIFIYWYIAILIEVFCHWCVIEKLKFDLTPDDKWGLYWTKLIVYSYRVLAFSFLWGRFGEHGNTGFIMFFLGAMFSHLLIFPILLNLFRKKDWHYLGNGWFDENILGGKFLNDAPMMFHVLKVFWLMCLASGFTYAYFNTHWF